uniref:Apple domain-containing protein n=1 Tax=Scylla olivacea TaxID=85551 RepID=A0A0P4WMW9_SCYOL
MRIDSRFIRRELRTRNRRECELECDRESYCRGFNYRFKTQGFNQYRNNCQLSYQDGSSDFDFHSDLDFDFYEKDYNSQNCHTDQGGYHGGGYGGGNYGGGRDECFRLVEKQRAVSEREAAGSLMARDIKECELVCEQSWQFICKVFSFSYYSASGLRHNCLLSDMEYRDLPLHSLVHDRDSDLYERRLYDRECALDISGTHYQQGEGLSTVSGLRCYRESCRLDRHGGYYFCETDHSGAWDFCCRPHQKCGYSEGYPQAWCYVGSGGHDKWRPCNENAVRGRDFLKNRPDDASNNWTTTTETSPSTEYPPSTVHPLELIDMF